MGSVTTTAAKDWSSGSTGPVPAGQVHLWMVPLESSVADSRPFLDAGEVVRAAGYRRPADGARFAASRAGLRRLVAGYLDADPASLYFRLGVTGRPVAAVHARAGDHLAGDARDCDPRCAEQGTGDGRNLVTGAEFSLARTENLALIAVSAAPVGVDIERITPRPGLADLVAARFPAHETACLAGGCSMPVRQGERQLSGFYRHWTAREAYLKAIGCGLAGLRQVELTCWPRPQIRFGGMLADSWQLSFPAVAPEHSAAVVAHGPVSWCRWLAPTAP
jgi:4'-phosphopantetheinyl transferase